MSASGSEVSCFRMPVTPTTVALNTLFISILVALRSAVHECQQRLRSQIVASRTAAPKTLVFSVSVALRSAVHERQRLRSQLTTVALKTLVFSMPVALSVSCSRAPQLRSQLLLSSASDSDDSGSEDTCLLNASSSEVSCSRAPAAPKSAAFERQ